MSNLLNTLYLFNFQLPLIPISQPDLSASQTLASFHQQALDDSSGCSTLETSTNNTTGDVVTVTPIVIAKTCENTTTTTTNQQVKLPGGATLVAVTDRNADMLLKPKLLEKPHVTITINGDKQIEQPVCLYTNTVKIMHIFYFFRYYL